MYCIIFSCDILQLLHKMKGMGYSEPCFSGFHKNIQVFFIGFLLLLYKLAKISVFVCACTNYICSQFTLPKIEILDPPPSYGPTLQCSETKLVCSLYFRYRH